MATGRGSSPAVGVTGDAPRRPSLALQPFAWNGLQILPVAPSAAECVAIVPPPLPGLYRTAPFRVSEYDKRSRLAVAMLESALGLAAREDQGEVYQEDHYVRQGLGGRGAEFKPVLDADRELHLDLDLSDLHVPQPPGISLTLPFHGETLRNPDSHGPSGECIAAVEGGPSAPACAQPPSDSRLPVARECAPIGPRCHSEKAFTQQQRCIVGSNRTEAVLKATAAATGIRTSGEEAQPEVPEQLQPPPQSREIMGEPRKRRRLSSDLLGQHPPLYQQQPQRGGSSMPAAAGTLVVQPNATTTTEAADAAGLTSGRSSKPAVTIDDDDDENPQQRGKQVGNSCVVKDRYPAQIEPFSGNLTSAVSANARAAFPSDGAWGGTGSSGERLQGGSVQRQEGRVQQLEQAAAVTWWKGLRAAATQLESVRAFLQMAPRKRSNHPHPHPGRASGAEGARGGAARGLQEEMERGEKGREADDGGEGLLQRQAVDGPPGAPVHGAYGPPGALMHGAYGPATETIPGDEHRFTASLPAAAVTALERIQIAVLGPSPPTELPHTLRQPGAVEASAAAVRLGAAEAGALSNGGEVLLEPGLRDELVMWIAVCGPGQPHVLHEEYLVLGSQNLAELRDMMGCATEDAMRQAAQGIQTDTQTEGVLEVPTVSHCAGRSGRSRGRGSSRTRRALPGKMATEAGGEAGGSRRAGRGRRGGRGGSRCKLQSGAECLAVEPRCPAGGLLDSTHDGADGPLIAAAAPTNGGGPSVPECEAPSDGAWNLRGAGGLTEQVEGPSVGHSHPTIAKPVAPSPSPPPPPQTQLPFAGELLPPSHGSYLFLEGRFFTDSRHHEAEDYTAPIRELCSAHGVRPTYLRPERGWRPALVRLTEGSSLPPPAAMHLTLLADLTLRQANHPTGIFCHRACCEHLVFVRDVRRWHPGDPPNRAAFPLRLRTRDRAGAPVPRRRCSLCEARFAELVTHDDPLAPSNPAVMCRHCFDLLHVSSDGKRIAPHVVVQPYNPALDIATMGTWAPSAGSWATATAAAAAVPGGTNVDGGRGGGRRLLGRPR